MNVGVGRVSSDVLVSSGLKKEFEGTKGGQSSQTSADERKRRIADIMRPVESFLEALEGDKWSQVLEITDQHHLRSSSFDIEEFLQTLPKRSRPRLYEALSKKGVKLASQMQELLEDAYQGGEDEAVQSEDNENKRLSLYTDLRALVLLLRVSLKDCKDGGSAGKLLPAMEAVHSVLLVLQEDAPLQDSVARLCETWWAQGFSGREHLMAQTIPYVVARALDNGKAADVHRVYAVRQAVPMFDFADESIESLKKLLLRCVFAPPFLKSADGERFIVYLCGLNASMVREIFAIVKNQIPSGRKSILETYGEILFKAWKIASGPCLYELEQNCIQRLMEACLYASTPSLASNIRRVLDGFHSQKKQRGVDELLLRLYEPLLFRALQVANTSVRHNALLLFVDAFPLQNPDAAHEQTDALLQKQVGLLDSLLSDPAPIVRASAVEGVCRILRVFWELIPSQTTAKMIARLVEELSYDGTSSAVRAAVLDGVTYLLHNPLSHPLVKAVLPRLAPMINDTVPRVRLATAELLLAVRNISSLDKVDQRSNMDALLTSLASADAPLAKKLTRLLLRSYVPTDCPASEAAEKILALIKQDANAGAQFCKHMQEQGAPTDTVVQIASLLCTAATESIIVSGLVSDKATRQSRASKRKAGTDITNKAPTEERAPELSVGQQEAVLDATAALAKGMVAARTDPDTIATAFPGSLLVTLLEKAASGVARSSVLRLAGALPPSEVPALIQHCARRLASSRTPESDPAAFDEIQAILSFVTSWGGLPDLSAAMVAALSMDSSSPPAPVEPTPVKGKKRGRKKTAAVETLPNASPGASADSMTPAASARYLELLLEDEAMRTVLLEDTDSVNALFGALQEAVQAGLQGTSALSLPQIIRAYTKLIMHWALFSQATSPEDTDSEAWSTAAAALVELINWSQSTLTTPEPISESVLEFRDTPQPKRTRSRVGSKNESGEKGEFESALLTVLTLCGDAVVLGLLPANETEHAALPLRFAATFVRHVPDVMRTSKHVPAADAHQLLKSTLSHAARLVQIWPESNGHEQAELADAILTVAATSEPAADTCPAASGQAKSPGTDSASNRATVKIAFGHRVESPSSKKSPEKSQDGSVDGDGGKQSLADEMAAALKPWLEELFSLVVSDDVEAPVSATWLPLLLDGWMASDEARARSGPSTRKGREKEETTGETAEKAQNDDEEEGNLDLPPLLQSLLAVAEKRSGPVRAALANAAAESLLRHSEDEDIHKASRAADLLGRIVKTKGDGNQSLRSLLKPAIVTRIEQLPQSPIIAEPPSGAAESFEGLSSYLRGLLS